MSLKYDPEFFKVFEPLIPILSQAPKQAPGDVEGRRTVMAKGLEAMASMIPMPPADDVEQTEHKITTPSGAEISVFSFIKKAAAGQDISKPGPAILHAHGGGMIIMSVKSMEKVIAGQVQACEIPIFSVDYRLAPESNGSALVEDCYAGLTWLHENAQKFNVDPKRIAVMGESAGGGIAAGVALMARDKNLSPPLAKQILVYPMLDDRTKENAQIKQFASWNYDDNTTGWGALLGEDKAGKPDADVSYYAVPARVKSVEGLPSTYIDVGGLDVFRDEDLEYAQRLAKENIDVEFHLYPGLPHAFELTGSSSGPARRALENRMRAMMSF